MVGLLSSLHIFMVEQANTFVCSCLVGELCYDEV